MLRDPFSYANLLSSSLLGWIIATFCALAEIFPAPAVRDRYESKLSLVAIMSPRLMRTFTCGRLLILASISPRVAQWIVAKLSMR